MGGLEIGKNEGFKFGRISLKSEKKGEGSDFYFQIFGFMSRHGLGMLRLDLKTRVL